MSASPIYGQIGLSIAFLAFLAVIVDLIWLRRAKDLEHDLHLPLDEATPVSPPSGSDSPDAKGGHPDGTR